MVPEHPAGPAAHGAQDRDDDQEQPDHYLDPPRLGEHAHRKQDPCREWKRRMELVEDRHEVREHEDDQNSTNADREHEDDRGVDHRAAQFLQRGVLPLQVGGDLNEHPVERAAVLGRPHHVHVQLVENARVTGYGGRERFTGLQVVEDVVERRPKSPRGGCSLQELDRVGDWDADPDERGELAREENQVGGLDMEEGRKLAVDPAPSAASRPHGYHPEAAIDEVAVHRSGRLAAGDPLLQLSTR